MEERVARLLLATNIDNLDLFRFYTQQQLAAMLGCDPKTLERRREKGEPPYYLSLNRSVRYPAIFFWAWVADEIVKHFSLFAAPSREPAAREE